MNGSVLFYPEEYLQLNHRRWYKVNSMESLHSNISCRIGFQILNLNRGPQEAISYPQASLKPFHCTECGPLDKGYAGEVYNTANGKELVRRAYKITLENEATSMSLDMLGCDVFTKPMKDGLLAPAKSESAITIPGTCSGFREDANLECLSREELASGLNGRYVNYRSVQQSMIPSKVSDGDSTLKEINKSSGLLMSQCSGWESLTVEEALEKMADLQSLDNCVEKCVCLLQKCKRNKCLSDAMLVHSHICNNGLETHRVLGSYLVSMFVECGSLYMAHHVFNKLTHYNEYSWTYLLQGYVECGDPEYCLDLFSRIRCEETKPSTYTFVAVLTACSRLRCLERGLHIHAWIVKEGLEKDLSVARALVDFYAKCDMIIDANELFDELPSSNMYLNPLSQCKAGQVTDQEPLQEVLSGDVIAFIYRLKACSSITDLINGRLLHLQTVKQGYDLERAVGNTLIDMYSKCGQFPEAENLLFEMPNRDVVSWTALIMGYVKYRLTENALDCLVDMQEDRKSPNAFTYVSCLKACGTIQEIDKGYDIHNQVMKRGFYVDFVVCNSLIDMYAKCGLVDEAYSVFSTLAVQDIISWTSLIGGYAEHGPYMKALECFEQMQEQGVFPNTVTYIYCLKACSKMGDLDSGLKLHKELVGEGLEDYVFVANSIVTMYATCGSYSEARAVLYDLPGRDVVTWTALIGEYADDGLGEEALKAMEEMQNEGLSPNSITYASSLKACGIVGALEKGKKLHSDIVKRGLENATSIQNALSEMYTECGKPLYI